MPPPFHPLTVEQFAVVLRQAAVRRRITAVHLHHTWRPRHRDYKGHDTIVGMWRYHTREQGWRDIAQHLTIAPDGTLWTGRPWDWPPVSASGHNGNATAGPFMIEVIGNFDHNEDPFVDPQRAATFDAVAHLLARFELTAEAIRFHRQMSSKSCPGHSLDRAEVLRDVASRMEALAARPAERARGGLEPFGDDMNTVYDALAAFSAARRAPQPEDELPEAEASELPEAAAPLWTLAGDGLAGARNADSVELTPAVIDLLRPHVVNLSNGRFAGSGTFTTSRLDVDAIFDERLPKALADAKSAGQPLRIVLYAHGGLISEDDGLRGALKHVDWWLRNGVYPLYFVWETGVLETLRSLFAGSRAARDLFDFTDAQVEALARRANAGTLWTGMKENARRAVDPDGGGTYTVRKLAEFCQAHGGDVELHAVGHSAGSIFHAHLLPAAIEAGVPLIKTLHYLAPAIRVDAFLQQISPHLGTRIGPLTMYTMRDTFERADSVAGFYRKSLLFLLYHALEDERATPILGLEASVRADLRLKRLFGITPGVANPLAEVVWSTTAETGGRAASQSTTHGGFDDDPATMNSVLRRVLGVDDAAPIAEFVKPRAAAPPAAIPSAVAMPAAPAVSVSVPAAGVSVQGGGARRALCVGINRYRTQPLSGCVADAQAWAATLRSLGFAEVRMLTDEEATREAILRELRYLISGSAPGDTVVFQFAGHGTTLPDRNADELGGDTPQHDEAICPSDFHDGLFILDDDLAVVYASIGAGVSVTNFIDCCHSGSITRFGAGMAGDGSRSADERPRFVVADPEAVARHLRFRAASGGRAARGPASMQEVLFAACRSNELAWESNGQGDFTRAATALLRRGIEGVTNERFESLVIAELGATPRQHPELDCAPAARTRPLLAGARIGAAAAATAAAGGAPGIMPGAPGQQAAVADVLTAIAALLRK